MATRGGISGVAASMGAVGVLLVWTGITNVSLTDALRDLIAGRTPGTGGTPTGPSLAGTVTALDTAKVGRFAEGSRAGGGGGTATPSAIGTFVETARAQLGKPYRWGAAGPSAFDCSGLVTYALKAAGLDNRRRVTAEYLVWTGAVTVPSDQTRYGDLVCWPGHIGIAVSGTEMIHAPSAGRPVQVGRIWWTPAPRIRRIRAGGGGGGSAEVT